MACLMITLFFEALLFPCIFVISTKGMGRHTRRAASLLISSIGGGAVFPPIQGGIADRHGTPISFATNIPAFLYIAGFSLFLWFRNGAHFNLREEPLAKVEPALEAGKTSLALRHTHTGGSEKFGAKVEMHEEKEKI
ncbi:hypothetical protein FRC06_006935 [Ceratobasidium sp. 370]|nr:hypothetical protein FRC06_006935 [Ceratobasidium sp. 370]